MSKFNDNNISDANSSFFETVSMPFKDPFNIITKMYFNLELSTM